MAEGSVVPSGAPGSSWGNLPVSPDPFHWSAPRTGRLRGPRPLHEESFDPDADESVRALRGRCALLVAAVGVLYSFTFVIVVADEPKWAQVANAIFLLSGGLLALAVLVAVYARLREVEPSFALLALVLGLAGGLGSAIHGAQEFALEVRKENATDTGLSAVDPRGFLTFAVSGPALLLIGWLVRRGGLFPSGSET